MDDDAARASARVFEGAITLAKAEVRLMLSELRNALRKAVLPLALLWTAAFAAHMAVALTCVSPLLVPIRGAPLVLFAIALSAGLGALLGVVGVARMRAAFTRPATDSRPAPHGAAPPSRTLQRGGT